MELRGFDETSLEQQNQPEEQEQKEKKPLNLKKWAGLILFILVVVAANIYNKIHEADEAKKEEERQIAADELETIMNDAHLQRDYYLNTAYSEWTNQSAADMIGHVILTGCKDSYESLRKYFDANSMQYLYSFLGGYSCKEWVQVPCSLQERGVNFEDYKIVDNDKVQYLVHINLDKDLHPVSFSISDYFTGRDILDSSEGDISGDMEEKDHSDIKDVEELTTEETTIEETTEAKKSFFKK